MPRPDELPKPPQITPPRQRPAWAVALVAALATAGAIAALVAALATAGAIAALVGALSLTWFGLGPIGSAATSPRTNAGGSSEIPLASSVTPVTFDQALTMIAAANPSPGPFATVEPLAVWIADDPPPTIPPTHLPATATIVAQVTATARANATATAAARPRSCYESLPGRVCIWPSPTATTPPPLPTLPPCLTPIVGELCVLYGALGGAVGTPLPVILDIVSVPEMPEILEMPR